ncbi:hypothetical protein I8751_06035 [Nostocaceae cyanobacterium CENA357]|uniref:DUF6888 domain-containing protein n=1 Tax=Atlanticothrix silvestris CENA357 TaxID=1725252 RepID=A0A8J7KXL0_9CYAN|nr:hypothetical protein [Atlanticothrix silvestris]MBH8551945.1 hypothetical protein [Atlanticothrix silvestris CENA357]
MQEPTIEQAKELFRVCYQLTNMYCSIHLVRIDKTTSRIYILAGEETQLEIFPNGSMRYL